MGVVAAGVRTCISGEVCRIDALQGDFAALDRVLLHGHYLSPTQVEPGGRWTYWDRYGRPETSAKKRYYSFPETWWVDPEKDAAVDAYLSAQREQEED